MKLRERRTVSYSVSDIHLSIKVSLLQMLFHACSTAERLSKKKDMPKLPVLVHQYFLNTNRISWTYHARIGAIEQWDSQLNP